MTQRTPDEQDLFTQLGGILQGRSEGALTLTPALIAGIEGRSKALIDSNSGHAEGMRRIAGDASRETVLALMNDPDFAQGSAQAAPWRQVRERLTPLTGLDPID